MTELNITDADLHGLKDKVVIITGGSSGIGLETVNKLLSQGALVVNGDLNPPLLASTTDKLNFVPLDVTNWDQLSALFAKTIEIHGRIDHVCANAGIGPTTNYLDEHFDDSGKLLEPSYRTIDINLKAVINTASLAFHYMRKQETGGSVVLTASASSFQRFRAVDYATAKHGVLGFMRGMVPITHPKIPIRINVVAPDWTTTNIIPQAFITATEAEGTVWQSPEVVARSIGLLMADASRHGQMLYSVGGRFFEMEDILLGSAAKLTTGPSLDYAASFLE